MNSSRLWIFQLTIAIATLFPNMSFATLGEKESSIEVLRKASRTERLASIRSRRSLPSGQPEFTVQVLKNSGTEIREYINTSTGKIFAVTWIGHRTPPTAALLGSYAQDVRTLERSERRSPQNPRGSRTFSAQNQRLVVTRSGHPRALRGKVIARTLAPAGVSLDEIQ